MAYGIVKSQSFYRQQIFLSRMTGRIWIKHTDIALVHRRIKRVVKEVFPIFQANPLHHHFDGELLFTQSLH